MQINPQLYQQTTQEQQGEVVNQQIHELQEQVYITQKNQQEQLEILKDLVCELKKER